MTEQGNRRRRLGSWTALSRGFVASVIACGLTAPAGAEDGVGAGRILFGQTAGLDGPSRELGRGMRLGLEAAFAEANRAGGIGGRRLELISYDDRYEPELAIANARRLIESDRVFALIGSVGTPTSRATLPIAGAAGVPFVGPFTGAPFLRDPSNSTVVNVRASYDQETEALVERLTKDLGLSRIAVLFQDDSFGRAGLAGVRAALAYRLLTTAGEGAYRRNSAAVKSALLSIRRSNPEAIVLVGTYEPIAAFIKWARKLKTDVPFATVSFVGTRALMQELGPEAEGVIVSQVMPSPFDPSLALVAEYQAAIAAIAGGVEPGYTSLEGYLVGRVALAALERCAPDLTRKRFLDVFRDPMPFDIGGLRLQYGSNDNQGLDDVYLSVLRARGEVDSVDRLERR
jgi:ABC-type branched-subunit amino acid transport system substrate-binding protein